MRLPRFLTRRETRADQNYTDVVLQSMLAAASGEVANGLTAGREIAAGHWQRAFSSAAVRPEGVIGDAISPHLGFIGRSLIERGEAIFAVDFDDGLILLPADGASISGGPNPKTWSYELTLAGPSSTATRRPLRADDVLHLTYAVGARNPWRGISPIEASGTTQKLLDNIELRLAQELGGAVGNVIPVPNVQTSSKLQSDLRALKGEIALVESTASNWGAGQSGAPPLDFNVQRVGADPPASIPELRRQVEESILAAAGVPVSALGGANATAHREAFRQFLHLTIEPVADAVAAQVRAHFEVPDFAFSFDRLFAADLSGRARAFQSMVNGGMDVAKAAALAGLMEAE